MSNSVSHYDAVLRDLRAQRDEIDTMIKDVERLKRFAEMRSGIFQDNESETEAPASTQVESDASRPYAPRAPRRGGITIVAGAEQILREAGKPLHVSGIVERLAEMGKQTKARSANSTLLQDPQGRFVNLGSNTFALKEWESKEEGETQNGKTDFSLQ